MVGSEKILYGSDYPLKVYPKTQKKADMETFVKEIQTNAELSETEYEQIFEKNINHLLNLQS
jgi:predicted TIM-barrel fold metal-dependent hydrolase